MGLFKGALTLRRYRVVGEVPEDFRTVYAKALNDNAFRAPASKLDAGEMVGWCCVQNLLDTDFDDLNQWLFDHYLVAAMRVDKKALPSKLFRAHLDKRVAAWCREHGRARAPASVRADLRDALEQEMLARTLPRVQVYEFCWDLVGGYVLFHNTSDAANDRFRKLFRVTFGIDLVPFSPLDLLADEPDLAAALEVVGLSDCRPDGSGAAPTEVEV